MDQIKNNQSSNAQRVAAMNIAFGNPKGDPKNINWGRIHKQSLNILDEWVETMVAFGANKQVLMAMAVEMKLHASCFPNPINPTQIRDGLTDIHVFAYGAHHLMGIDADEDMVCVLEGVMTRFIKNEADKAATIAKHAEKGVTDVYFEGEYPVMVMKSASDQPDAPKGKFLKSASYREPVFNKVA